MNGLTSDLTCQRAVELVTDYLEGRLTRRMRRRLKRHLAGCPHCSQYFEQIRTSIRLTGSVDAEKLDPAARADLLDLYRRYRNDDRT